MYRLRDHINRRVYLQFDPAKETIALICDRPDLRMHLRYRSIPGLLLNQPKLPITVRTVTVPYSFWCHS